MLYNILKFKLALFISIICMVNINSKVIIWDLGNVLFRTSKMSALSNIGFFDYLFYPISSGKNPYTVKDKAFSILNLVKFPHINDNLLALATDEVGQVLPPCFRAWMSGLVSGDEIIHQANHIIERLSNKSFKDKLFSNDREKRLVLKTLNFIFEPNLLSGSQRPIRKAVNILKQCYENNHELVVLSNWDSVSFPYLYNSPKGKIVFQYFKPENIFVSGNIKLIKPDIKFFQYALNSLVNRYGIKAQDCIFIDDQEVNVNAANECGITGILLVNGNYRKLKKELKNLSII